MKIERGMVLNVNLDTTKGSETGKIRPCIVVTNDVYNERVPVIQVVPITGWNAKKAKIKTNVVVNPTVINGLRKKSIADCLQTRPIDHRFRLEKILGKLSDETLNQINHALRIVFKL